MTGIIPYSRVWLVRTTTTQSITHTKKRSDKKIHMPGEFITNAWLYSENWNLSSQSSLLASVYLMRSRRWHTTTRYPPRFCLRSSERKNTHGTSISVYKASLCSSNSNYLSTSREVIVPSAGVCFTMNFTDLMSTLIPRRPSTTG